VFFSLYDVTQAGQNLPQKCKIDALLGLAFSYLGAAALAEQHLSKTRNSVAMVAKQLKKK